MEQKVFSTSSKGAMDLEFKLVCLGWIFTGCQLLFSLVKKVAAPYGKHSDGMPWTKVVGCLNARTSWFLQESPAFFVPLYMAWNHWPSVTYRQALVLGLFVLHYAQRVFVYPFLIRDGRDCPVVIVASGFAFCAFNGFLQGHSALNVKRGPLGITLTEVNVVLGLLLFFSGLIINIDSDRRLRISRGTASSRQSRRARYPIPRGGFFELVSSANYFGEIVEWWGYALVARLSPASTLFAGFTTIFLGLRGIATHRFYMDTFGREYPRSRKAVIPFIV